MAKYTDLALPEDPKLAHNITWFARALRNAGLPIGPGRTIDAIRAVEAAGFTDRRDFYWTLHACFVTKRDQHETFDQIFRLYWRDPRYMEQMISFLSPMVRGVSEERQAKAAEKRAAEALLEGAEEPELPKPEEQPEPDDVPIDVDASRTTSDEERLRTLDFEQMSNAEMARAKRMIARLTLPVQPLKSRRTMASDRGMRPDWRRTMRSAMRRGGEITQFERRTERLRYPSLIAICDISGSMSHYSRAVLHFLHTVANQKGAGWADVHSFTFGTRLTNITRHLRQRDVDAALAAAGAQAQDWEGGTRIGTCIDEFNRTWSRRVMGQGAIVLLITDGLDRGDPQVLERAMSRLQLSARKVIWLNPLLRFDGFAPRAKGVATMMRHVDSFRAGHDIASLEGLAAAIAKPDDTGEKARMMALMRG